MNPYHIIERVLRVLSIFFKVVLTLGIFTVSVLAAWPRWGWWALTAPFILLFTFAGASLLGIGLAMLFSNIKESWDLAKENWKEKRDGR